jgi:hypothetical protein
MSKRNRLMTKILFFVILFAGFCWPEAGDAFEPWEGKATTVLNVRKSPELDSQAIGWLDKGQRITINDEQKLWYKIIFEIEGKKYRVGWVYRRYIRRISSEKMDMSSALAKVRAGIAVEELQEKIPLDASAGKDRLRNKEAKALKKASISAEVRVVKDQGRMAPRKSLPSDKKVVRDTLSEKINAVKEQTRAPSRSKPATKEVSTSPAPATNLVMKEQTHAVSRAKPPAPKMAVSKSPGPKMVVVTSPPPAITPVISKRVDTPPRTSVSVVQNPLKQEPRVSHPQKSLADTQEFKELAKLVLRLLSVVLSCLAILFSYKAIKLSKISYNTAMQLQRNLQVWQQREDGQLG